jgi:5-methylcytosine-specific restriction endonuclease McrBC regulatory subunit McrC
MDKKDHYDWQYPSEEEHPSPSIVPGNKSSGEAEDNANINGELGPRDQLSTMSGAGNLRNIEWINRKPETNSNTDKYTSKHENPVTPRTRHNDNSNDKSNGSDNERPSTAISIANKVSKEGSKHGPEVDTAYESFELNVREAKIFLDTISGTGVDTNIETQVA